MQIRVSPMRKLFKYIPERYCTRLAEWYTTIRYIHDKRVESSHERTRATGTGYRNDAQTFPAWPLLRRAESIRHRQVHRVPTAEEAVLFVPRPRSHGRKLQAHFCVSVRHQPEEKP